MIIKLITIILTMLIIGVAVFFVATRINSSTDDDTSAKSIYEWRSVTMFSSSEVRDQIATLRKDRIGTIYLSIGEMIDIAELPEGAAKQAKKKQYHEQVQRYITEAHTAGITVEALTGDKEWTEDSHRYLIPISLAAITEYNDSVSEPERFSGVQFDIEPYNIDTFSDDKEGVLVRHITGVKEILDILKNAGQDQLSVGFALPYWYDGENGNIPEVTYAGKTAYPFYHIADILADHPKSYVSLMAYRNNPAGENGTIALSEKELTYLNQPNQQTKLWIAQETVAVEPATITYFGKGREATLSAFKQIVVHFRDNAAFAGIAIHDAEGYEGLR